MELGTIEDIQRIADALEGIEKQLSNLKGIKEQLAKIAEELHVINFDGDASYD